MKYRILVICVLFSAFASAQTKPKTSTTAKTSTTTKTTTTKANSNTAAPVLKNGLDSFSYALGMSVGNFCSQQQIKNLNTTVLMKGVNDANKSGKPLLTEQQMNSIITTYLTKQSSEKARVAKAAGEKFLAENAKKPGVTTTASGLQYLVMKAGTDTVKPKITDEVICHYHGSLVDGTVFESTVNSGQPARFKVNEVVSGWIEALQLMPKGSKWRLFIPSDLGYGDRGSGPIPGGAVIIFELELLDILKPE